MSVAHFSENDFKTQVLQSAKPVLVDFYADWCGPCRVMSPIVEEVAHLFGDKLAVGKVDVDQNQALAETLQIMSIPTLLVVKGGKIVERLSGLQNKSALIDKIKAVV